MEKQLQLNMMMQYMKKKEKKSTRRRTLLIVNWILRIYNSVNREKNVRSRMQNNSVKIVITRLTEFILLNQN